MRAARADSITSQKPKKPTTQASTITARQGLLLDWKLKYAPAAWNVPQASTLAMMSRNTTRC